MTTRLLDAWSRDWMNTHARSRRMAVLVDGVMHEVVKIDGNTASVTYACVPTFAVLLDPLTEVHAYDEVDVDCMACLASRVRP